MVTGDQAQPVALGEPQASATAENGEATAPAPLPAGEAYPEETAAPAPAAEVSAVASATPSSAEETASSTATPSPEANDATEPTWLAPLPVPERLDGTLPAIPEGRPTVAQDLGETTLTEGEGEEREAAAPVTPEAEPTGQGAAAAPTAPVATPEPANRPAPIHWETLRAQIAEAGLIWVETDPSRVYFTPLLISGVGPGRLLPRPPRLDEGPLVLVETRKAATEEQPDVVPPEALQATSATLNSPPR